MNPRQLYRRFRAWQKAPRRDYHTDVEPCRCANCGNEYTGRFCPLCGQAAGERRTTWASVRKSFMLPWGMDSRSMLSSIWQLIWRPGYFIGDYLDGHHQASYPPVNMLFIIVLLYAVLKQMLGIGTDIDNLTEQLHDLGGSSMLYTIMLWLFSHPGWTMLAMSLIMTLPVWILFRHAPRHTRHSLPESIFIQIFMSTLMMLVTILQQTVTPWLLLLIPFYNYLTYRQLFGYTVWGTLWRTAVCMLVWLNVTLLLASIIIIFTEGFTTNLSAILVPVELLGVIAAILAVGYWIGWKTRKS